MPHPHRAQAQQTHQRQQMPQLHGVAHTLYLPMVVRAQAAVLCPWLDPQDQIARDTLDIKSAGVESAASFVSTALVTGCRTARVEARLTLTGEGAFGEAGGALLTRGGEKADSATVADHAAPEGTSRQIWRAVAADTSTASIASRAAVRRDAQKTDGEQSLRGLLLKRTATVNLKPELEIFADDVRCTPGATVGRLDDNALFYLRSRGIPLGESRTMLIDAFVREITDAIAPASLRDHIAALIEVAARRSQP